MFFTCYNYHSNRVTNTVIFVKDKNIINVYINLNDNYDDDEDYDRDYAETPLLVISEEDIEKYPTLYNIYITSILLTADSTKLIEEDGCYSIRKKTIWKNLYITNSYGNEDTYMFNYPVMSYNLSSQQYIQDIAHIIDDIIMIDPILLSGLIEDEIYKLEKDLSICEDYTKNLLMYSLYMKKIMPDIPDDLTNIILEKI
jgi:hypothetical protein